VGRLSAGAVGQRDAFLLDPGFALASDLDPLEDLLLLRQVVLPDGPDRHARLLERRLPDRVLGPPGLHLLLRRHDRIATCTRSRVKRPKL
jgi:hypothetical protein